MPLLSYNHTFAVTYLLLLAPAKFLISPLFLVNIYIYGMNLKFTIKNDCMMGIIYNIPIICRLPFFLEFLILSPYPIQHRQHHYQYVSQEMTVPRSILRSVVILCSYSMILHYSLFTPVILFRLHHTLPIIKLDHQCSDRVDSMLSVTETSIISIPLCAVLQHVRRSNLLSRPTYYWLLNKNTQTTTSFRYFLDAKSI